MTPTEIIAVKLFGWQPSQPHPNYKDHIHDWRWYRRVHLSELEYPYRGLYLAIDNKTGQPALSIHGRDWPNLANWNDIRRMEDALAERGLFSTYQGLLADGEGFADEAIRNGIYNRYKHDIFNAKRATAEQCVAAAVKVLEAHK